MSTPGKAKGLCFWSRCDPQLAVGSSRTPRRCPPSPSPPDPYLWSPRVPPGLPKPSALSDFGGEQPLLSPLHPNPEQKVWHGRALPQLDVQPQIASAFCSVLILAPSSSPCLQSVAARRASSWPSSRELLHGMCTAPAPSIHSALVPFSFLNHLQVLQTSLHSQNKHEFHRGGGKMPFPTPLCQGAHR